MQLNRLFREGKEALKLLDHYDKTRELLIGRKRIDITLDKKLILALRKEARKKNIPLSRLVEQKLVKEIRGKFFKV